MNPQYNVCPVKIRSKHSSNTLLRLLRIFTGQTLIWIFVLDYSENEIFLNLEVAGWGKTSASETTMNDQLQKLDMEYVNKATCENIYGRRMLNLGENRLCAQDEKESFERRGRRGLFGDHCKGPFIYYVGTCRGDQKMPIFPYFRY